MKHFIVVDDLFDHRIRGLNYTAIIVVIILGVCVGGGGSLFRAQRVFIFTFVTVFTIPL